MKDAYSFDRDEEGLDVSYWKYAGAYRRIFERCGLRFYECEGDVGLMGGEVAHEYLAPCPAGENEIALCEKGDYAANVEAAKSVPPRPSSPSASTRRARSRRPRSARSRRWPSTCTSTRALPQKRCRLSVATAASYWA